MRDLGTALGETGRLKPKRSDPDLFERLRFVNGVNDGYVEFNYHGWHQELLRHRITPQDMQWACDLLTGISHSQWREAFRAGGYPPADAERYIRRLFTEDLGGRAPRRGEADLDAKPHPGGLWRRQVRPLCGS